MTNSTYTPSPRVEERAAAQRKPLLQPYIFLHQSVVWLVLGVVVFLVALGMHRLHQDTTFSVQAQAEVASLQAIYLAAIDQETGLRGYVLTQTEQYLEPYYAGEKQFSKHLRQLGELVRASPHGVRLARLTTLNRLKEMHRQWLEHVAQPEIDAAKQGNLSHALEVVRSGEGKRRMDEMRALVETWLEGQQAKQARLSQQTFSTLAQVRNFALGGLLLALLTSVVVTTRATRAISYGLHQATEAAQRVAGGNLSERVPLDHVREGALLAVAFNEMTDQLAQRELELHSTYNFNRLILESAADGIVGIDREGLTTFANSATLTLTGFNREDLLGQIKHNLVHHTHPDGTPYPESECPAHHSLLDGQTRFITGEIFWRKDGTSFPVEYHVAPLKSMDGEIPGTVVTFRDVSERQAAERVRQENEAQLRAIVASLPIIIFAINKNSVYTLVEGREIKDLGISLDLIGKSIYDHHTDSPEIIEYFEKVLRGQDIRITTQRNERDFEIRLTPIKSSAGEVIGAVGVATEITDILHTQKELHKSNAELSRANMDLEQFMYAASHDLQTPLRTVSMFTELLAKHFEGQLDERSRTYVHHVLESAAQMKRLIDDLVTYSRIDKTEHDFEVINVEEVLKITLESLASSLEQADAVVTHDALPSLRADPMELRFLFYNLIENAVKYRSPERPLKVNVGINRDEYGWHFTVADNGIGIDKQYFERIFKMFQRLNPREYAGTGIGLAVCKKIVERHRGKIWVESTRGEGSTFHFTLCLPDSENGSEP